MNFRKIFVVFSLIFIPAICAAKSAGPKILSREKVKPSQVCDPLREPIGCAEAERLVIYNPRYEKVLVRVSCGSDFDETDLALFPRVRQEVTIETNIPGASCKISSWQILK